MKTIFACLHTCTSEWKNSMHGVNCKKARRLFLLSTTSFTSTFHFISSPGPLAINICRGVAKGGPGPIIFFGSVFATNAQSRFAIVLLDFVLELQPKSKTTDGVLVIFLYFWKLCTRQVKCPSRALCVISKRVWDVYEGVGGRNGSEKYFPNNVSLICPPGRSMIFSPIQAPP